MRQFTILLILLFSFSVAICQSSGTHSQTSSADMQSQYAKSRTARGFYYSFSYTNQNYSPLPSGKDLSSGLSWDNLSKAIPLGFTLNLFDTFTDTLYLNSFMEGSVVGISSQRNHKGPLLVLFSADLMDRSMDPNKQVGSPDGESPILFKTLGNPGNRLAILEFRNAGFKKDIMANGASVDYVNFQLIFIERTSNVEFHMGPSQVSDPEMFFDGNKGPAIGMITDFDPSNDKILGPGMWLSGSPYFPGTIVDFHLNHLEEHIPSGMVYQFLRTEISTDLEDFEQEVAPSIYPNPAQQRIKIDLPQGGRGEVRWVNLQGQVVLQREFYSGQSIELGNLIPGTYMVEVRQEGKVPSIRKITVN